MQARALLLAMAVSALPLGFAGCNACYTSQPSNPQQIRQQTADATAEMKNDAKAVTQGIRDGLTRPSSDKPLDLNSASKAQLLSLPGMDDDTAGRIISGRPYSSEHELLDKKVVSRDEYNKIADRVTVTR